MRRDIEMANRELFKDVGGAGSVAIPCVFAGQ
jgi:hypothetical protein